MSRKGKEVVGASSSKRKRSGDGSNARNDQTGGAGGRKRKDRGVLRFFDAAADEAEDSDTGHECDEDSDFMGEDYTTDPKMNSGPVGISSLPVFPKEEVMDEEEFDRMMEQRYKDGSGFVTYAGDDYEDKLVEIPSAKDPTIWKVKCMAGRERHSAFCLMQKFVHLKSLGNKLEIISAFSINHVKGFIFIEAEKQGDINEACNGLPNIYFTRVQPVPINEVSRLLNTPSKCNKISEGMWARVKSGRYKGDLAQVVAVNDARRRATVKLIPRIDLQALAAKFGGGLNLQKNASPAPRLISSADLEKFRPLIQYRRDQDTGKYFEVLDGMLLKDGYLYKKVSMDSLNFWGVEPNQEELLKFASPENDNADDLEWLSQLYGEQKKKRSMKNDKGAEKGEGTSGSTAGNGYEMHDLVCFNRKDFGVIVGLEKDDSYKILKDGPDGPEAVSVQRRDMKCGLFDLKLSALDKHGKTILVDDTVKITGGVMEGKQGVVKKIYKGVVFFNDENEVDNGGYLCCKSHMCEKITLSTGILPGKDDDPGPSCFDNFLVSPNSPPSPKEQPQASENSRQFNNGDQDEPFSIGQTMRIKVGPLKGYLCRVLAIRRTGITVKLDSKQKVLTVQSEHLAEVQAKGIAVSVSGNILQDPGQQLGLFGSEASSGGWNTEGTHKCNSGTETNDSCKGEEENPWSVKSAPNQNSSWCPTVDVNNDAGAGADQDNDLGKGLEIWNAVPATKVVESGSSSWERSGDMASSSKSIGDNWGKPQTEEHAAVRTSDSWNQRNSTDGNQSSGWGKKADDLGKSLSSGWNNSGCNKNSAETDSEGNKKDQSLWDSKTAVGGSKAAGDNWDTAQLEVADREKHVTGGSSASWTQRKFVDGNQTSEWVKKDDDPDNKLSSEWNNSGWNKKSAENDKERQDKNQGVWDSKTNNDSTGNKWNCSTTVQGSSEEGNRNSNWGSLKSETSNGERQVGHAAQASNEAEAPWEKKNSGPSEDVWKKASGQWGQQKPFGGNRDGNDSWNSGKSTPGSASGAGQSTGWGKVESIAGKLGSDNSNWSSMSAPGYGGNNSNRKSWSSASDGDSGDLGGKRENGNENWGSRPSGSSWTGGYGGGNDSDRGGFRGRGRGGFGGRGRYDRGDFGGRSDRGGFGGRGGFGRGAFRGRGRGRNEEDSNSEGWKSNNGSGTWGSNRNDSGKDTSSRWNGGEGGNSEGWRSNDGSGTWGSNKNDFGQDSSSGWNKGGGSSEGWQNSDGSGTWGSKKNDFGKDMSSGWNKGEGASSGGWASKTGSGTWGSHRNDFGKDTSSEWNKEDGTDDGSGTWNKGSERGGSGGGGEYERGAFSGRGHGRRDQYGEWSNRNNFGKNTSSGWNKGEGSNSEVWTSNNGSRDQGSERGGFGGRGGSERGAFRGRGRGRSDQSRDWGNKNDFGPDTSSGWNNGEAGSSEGWTGQKKSDATKVNEGSNVEGGWVKAPSSTSSGWNKGEAGSSEWWTGQKKSDGTKGNEGSNVEGGWGKAPVSTSSSRDQENEGSGWRKGSGLTENVKGSHDGDCWEKAPSSSITGGWESKGPGNKEFNVTEKTIVSNAEGCWGKSPSSSDIDGWKTKSSGQNEGFGVTEEAEGSNAEGCWGMAPSSSATGGWASKSSELNKVTGVTREAKGSASGFEQELLSGATIGDRDTWESGGNKESNPSHPGLEKGLNSSADNGDQGTQGSECNKVPGFGNGGNVEKSIAWDQPNPSETFASARNQPEKTIEATVEGREATDA